MGAAWPTPSHTANCIFAFFILIIYIIVQCNVSEPYVYVDAALCISIAAQCWDSVDDGCDWGWRRGGVSSYHPSCGQ